MRVDLIILFASCVLAASSSNASNVRRNPISSAIVQSVAESQQGLPVNRLLRSNETIIKEERVPNFDNLLRSKASRWSKLEDEAALKPFLTKEDGTPATASEIFQHKEFSILVKAFKKKPNVSLMALLSGKRGDKDVTMTLYRLMKSGSLKEKVAKKLLNEQFSYLHLKANRNAKRVFDTVLKTNDPKDPISMFNGEVEVLENYLRWRYRVYSNPKPTGKFFVADEIVRSLAEYVGRFRFLSMISTHQLNPEAQLLEKKLYELLLREGDYDILRATNGKVSARWRKKFLGKPDRIVAVQRLLWFAEIEKMGVELFNGKEVLNMMGRFYRESPGSQIIFDVRTTVKALKKAFGTYDGKYPAALLIAKAVEKKEQTINSVAKKKEQTINSVAKELEIEFFKQEVLSPDMFRREYFKKEEHSPDLFERVASGKADESDHDTIRGFVARYLEFERNKRKELNGGEGGLVAST